MDKINQEKTAIFKRDHYNHKDAGKTFLWAVILPYVITFMALLLGMSIGSNMGINAEQLVESLGFTIASAVITPLTFLSIFFIYNKTSKISLKACRLSFKINIKQILILISISLICVFGLQYFIHGIDLGLDAIGYNLSNLSLPLNNGWWYLLSVVVLALFPAVCEELIFRGMIFLGLRRNLKDSLAVVLSAVLFALMHGSLEQFVYPFILGLILSVLVLRTGNLLSSIIVHFLNNFIVVTFAFIENMTGFNIITTISWLFWLLAVGLLLVTFGLLYVIDKFYFKHKSNLNVEKTPLQDNKSEGKFPSFYMIMGIIISLILFIVSIATSFGN